jgi:hypothetical protein
MSASAMFGEEDEDLAPRRKRKPSKPAATEAQIQRAIIDALRWRGIMAVHVPNAGKRSAIAGRRLKGEGMRPGFPDLVVKRTGWRPSDVSDDQRAMHERLRELGQVVEIVDGIDAALAVLRREGWLA